MAGAGRGLLIRGGSAASATVDASAEHVSANARAGTQRGIDEPLFPEWTGVKLRLQLSLCHENQTEA
jgi:hypothetical protein